MAELVGDPPHVELEASANKDVPKSRTPDRRKSGAALARTTGFVPLRETCSSLPLQMALYFHLHLDPIIFISTIGCLYIKYDHLHPTYRVILVAIHLISVLIEFVRPYLGYYGNLGEKIPALSGFWITTLFLQLPIAFFLCVNPDIYPLPLERFLLILHLGFLLVEAATSFFLVRDLAEYQVQRFKATITEDAGQQLKEETEYILARLPAGLEVDVSSMPRGLTETLAKRVRQATEVTSS